MLLSDKYPFLTEFFQTAIESENHPPAHSILFYGNDLQSQYTLALEIARLLNCTGDKTDNCQCLNCKWINEGKHPAVLTISRIDSKPDDDDSKTVISVKQSEMIRNMLITSSQFHRVFIFCDKDDEGNIQGLNKMNFQEATANSLLKSIEEPSERVTFIFLTRDKNDLISTIISRSQCFFVPTKKRQDYNFEVIESVLSNYWEIKRGDAFNVSEKLNALTKDTSPIEILEQFQNYMLLALKNNNSAKFLIDDIHSVELAKKQINQGMKSDIVFDELCLKIIR
ncbi:hypothetical protein J6O48_05265 [bacterium]|nr:hypothetical protein [bacterium]